MVVLMMVTACAIRAQGEGEARRRPLVGVIRWDAWTEWDKYQKYLVPKEWHVRLPFFAKVISDTEVQVRGDSHKVMDQEIAYAKAAGIDYWAWVWYDPQGTTATKLHMNDCLDLYRASSRKAHIKYCLIGTEYGATQHWPETVAELVKRFKERNYQKVLGNRPIYYWFDSQNVVPHFRSTEAARKALTLLRSKTLQAGLGSPYLVALCFWPDKGAQVVGDVGFDAMGSYCNPGGSEGREQPYSDLAAINRWFWNESRKQGKPFVPPVNVGWDPRPRKETLQNPNATWYAHATPQEVADHLSSALRWTRQNRALCAADTVLVYAWNEFDEGGWLCPTLSEGAARLQAIGKMLRSWRD